MKYLGKLMCAAVTVMAFMNSAHAVVVDFEDVELNFFGLAGEVQDGHQGLDWDNFGAVNTELLGVGGNTSGEVAAFNLGADATISGDEAFDFSGASFKGVFANNVQVEVLGFNFGTEVYSQTIDLSSTDATWFDFGFEGVTDLVFNSYILTPWGAKIGGLASIFTMDDFTFNESVSEVPLPASIWLMMAALGGFGTLRRRMNKA